MSQAGEALRIAHTLAGHPLGLVIALALLAALVEQRMARRRTPDFSWAYRDIHAHPPKPKSGPEPKAKSRPGPKP
ncbi:hypothetical protein [Phenylobacterium sp.]|jgi:hypothetical protein|uniref:hypothetical protein n=1 Tax=Phenylobacterium sp. TaxID=1871053 RepID=UPI0011F59DCB|nr:hypothetical protein [Phenylobacterium sp.]THD53712.1 MAG: hypothetical protein E8A12_18175 [Phenylobacterium sp.]